MVYRVPTSEETAAIATLRDRLAERQVPVCALGPGETPDDTLLRYLRSRGGAVDKAADKYAATLEWRQSFGVESLRRLKPVEALGCELDVLWAALPHAQRGVDRHGHPLIFKHMGAQCRFRRCVELSLIHI